MKTCSTCTTPLGRKNKTGYCRAHVSASFAQNPEWLEKQRAGIKRKIATDPEFLDSLRKRARIQGAPEDTRQQRSERFKRDEVWKIGGPASQEPEARAKAGRKLSATRMAWCPRELIPAYRELTALGYRAPEAKRLILDQHERDTARFAAKIALQPVVRVRVAAPEIVLQDEPDLPADPLLAVAALLDVSPKDVLGKFREQPLVDARAVVSMVMRGRGMSFPAIGRKLNRDHTSIMNLVGSFEQRAAARPHLARAVERLAA